MRWVKKGLVYGPDGRLPWARHSALQPTPVLRGDRIRVFVGFRDDRGAGSVAYVDVAADDPSQVLAVSSRPALSPGEPGRFDEDGVLPCAVTEHNGRLRLYYTGYQQNDDPRVRFRGFSGLAESVDGGETFTRVLEDPVMPPSDAESLFRVVQSIERDGDRFRAWYVAGSRFVPGPKKSMAVYDILYTESDDGVTFPDAGVPCVELAPGEYRIGRPWVLRHGAEYEMFYGVEKEGLGYRLGYARSRDGLAWDRRDEEIGIDVSGRGWDSLTIGYPAVVDTAYGRYLFYNGNDFGREGFGYAVLEDGVSSRR